RGLGGYDAAGVFGLNGLEVAEVGSEALDGICADTASPPLNLRVLLPSTSLRGLLVGYAVVLLLFGLTHPGRPLVLVVTLHRRGLLRGSGLRVGQLNDLLDTVFYYSDLHNPSSLRCLDFWVCLAVVFAANYIIHWSTMEKLDPIFKIFLPRSVIGGFLGR